MPRKERCPRSSRTAMPGNAAADIRGSAPAVELTGREQTNRLELPHRVMADNLGVPGFEVSHNSAQMHETAVSGVELLDATAFDPSNPGAVDHLRAVAESLFPVENTDQPHFVIAAQQLFVGFALNERVAAKRKKGDLSIGGTQPKVIIGLNSAGKTRRMIVPEDNNRISGVRPVVIVGNSRKSKGVK